MARHGPRTQHEDRPVPARVPGACPQARISGGFSRRELAVANNSADVVRGISSEMARIVDRFIIGEAAVVADGRAA